MQQQKQILKIEKKEEIEKEIGTIWDKGKLKREMKNLTLFMGLLAAAVGGRVALQYFPSVEPIIPIAVLAGLVFGIKEGFVLGGSAYVLSNFFVWGLQGPWTIFQAIGAALAGALAGGVGKIKRPKPRDLIILSVVGTVIFEVLMNISGPLMGIGLLVGALSIPLYFLTSLPFSLIHIGSNAFFAYALKPLLKLRRKEDELQIISFGKLDSDKLTTVRMSKYKP